MEKVRSPSTDVAEIGLESTTTMKREILTWCSENVKLGLSQTWSPSTLTLDRGMQSPAPKQVVQPNIAEGNQTGRLVLKEGDFGIVISLHIW